MLASGHNQGLIADNSLANHLINIAITISNDPVSADQLSGQESNIANPDMVSKYITIGSGSDWLARYSGMTNT